MKLTNHNKNYSYTHNTSVMRGTITMTIPEFEKAIKYLQKEYWKALKNIDTYKRDSLSKTIGVKVGNMRMFSLGVEATRLIVNKYHLKGYKDQNYGIKII